LTDEAVAVGTVKQRIVLFDYSASNTSNAIQPDQSADSWVYLGADETVMIGTCGVNEGAGEGNTFLRLFDPGSIEVASNDNGSSPDCGLRSKLSYTAPAAGYYMVRAGCFELEACSGTVAISRRRASQAFIASDTSDATVDTVNMLFRVDGGDLIRVSTCASTASGAFSSGDTFLRLYRREGGLFTQVAVADNTAGCGAAAELLYMAPSAGYYQVRAGCASATSCSGTLAIYVE
jgi:hypothetical protein